MSGDLYVGLMSGTSLDGVDAALVDFSPVGTPACLATHYQPYPDDLKAEVLALHEPGENEIARAGRVANRLARKYADAVRKLLTASNMPSTKVRAIGCHGQTIRHAPAEGYTLQLNNPALLVELAGITVVADFRSRDIAAGGQGAPLVPAFHDAVFRIPDRHRIILNIGGIANITDLAPGRPTGGFDCGPGNMLLDAWIHRCQCKPFDQDGQWGGSGKALPELLARLVAHPFFETRPPKSCGREQFNLGWLESMLSGEESPEDVQTTLAALTATGIADAIGRWCGNPEELFVCGGGARNTALLGELSARLPSVRIATTDVLGLPADWVEAIAFAWLARRSLLGLPGNLPEVTGARGERMLGAVYPA
ncbi:MAG: anhydro-N-acetylmuramic acid kinase [Candidatus Nitricoxidivorans perseverans]|uniref:Anhydro-N-acetylmuramic acid kinase n=1 Tax=Candidatus Nitricoxidivorans perseverans TaxID=2975601 RepID=A0AA49FKG9_9PROT|nr:MAG: anhydro-N-acetylmuramic acid kinase [Candidatus Nitricoxidivorans perseverans]